VDESGDRLGGVLESCGNSICLQENFGGGSEQRPVRLDGGGDLRPEAGLARGGEVEQGVTRHQREPRVAVGGLLAGLDHDARRFEFDQGVVGLALVHRDVNDQAGRVQVVQEGIDFTAKL